MQMFIVILLWLHFMGIALGLGAGISLSQVAPRLVAAAPGDARALDTLEMALSRIGITGLTLLLVTGPLLLWLRFGGIQLMSAWFWVKMAFVALTVVGVATSKWATGRFRAGERQYAKLMLIGGRVAGISAVLAMLCATLTFN